MRITGTNSPLLERAEINLFFSNGAEIAMDLSPAMLEIIVKSCGLKVNAIGRDRIEIARYDDKTIKEVMMPRLSSMAEA